MDYVNTLRYWHRLEHFYPYNIHYSKSENIKRFSIIDGFSFPNFKIHGYDDKYVAYYDVYFGLFKVSKAMEIVEKELGEQKTFIEKDQSESCFCKFSLTKDGKFSRDSFKISAYPWAVHRINGQKINLDQWDEDFKSYNKVVFSMFNDNNTEFTYDLCLELRERLANTLNWDIEFSSPWMVIETHLVDQEFTEDNEKEELDIDKILQDNDLLNSFYVKDIERVIESYKCNEETKNLNEFIKHNYENRIDIEENYAEIRKLMNPKLLPVGSWPSNYGLRFMQQLDINLFLTQNEKSSIFSINGPPGTGKTTLLKSLVAALIVERAEKLAKLLEPNQAFEDRYIGYIQYKNNKNWIYKLKEEYNQYGMLIASNNNGAVENISKELPSINELPQKYRDTYTYLNKVSDNIFGHGKTWGLLAATLGKRKNRNNFINEFWPISDNTKYSLQHSINKECDIEDWQNSVQQFQDNLNIVSEEIKLLDKIYDATLKYFEVQDSVKEKRSKLRELEKELSSLDTLINKKTEQYNLLINEKENNNKIIKEFQQYDFLIKIKSQFPKFFPKTIKYSKLCTRNLELLSEINSLEIELKNIKDSFEKIEQEIKNLIIIITPLENQVLELKTMVDQFKKDRNQDYSFIEFLDPALHDSVSKKSPYGYASLNEMREKLFFSALRLHESFVLNSSRMKSNLDAFNKWMRDMCKYEDRRKYSKVLLDSFFMVVPVVSSTFASVSTFLRDIGKEEIPYVFVDEAGQGIPQSAAGILWRAKRSIIVGDPIQIEPIFTIHDRIISALKEYYEQDDIIADRLVSVQTLADLANPYVGYRSVGMVKQIVGAPLIVHSRCKKTVFNIANEIAYDKKMIFDTFNGEKDDIYEWIHVQGHCDEGHFIKEQADRVWEEIKGELLSFKDSELGVAPSIYIISPFKTVKEGMIIYFRKKLRDSLSVKRLPKSLSNWLHYNIGTIHTFQGKEADKVYLCLGVDSSKKNGGAVTWASQSPNILNVAITRAKIELYIVGDKLLWGSQPYFEVALKYTNN